MTNKQVVERIFEVLQRQKFTDWDNGQVNSWICEDLPAIEDEDIKEDIRRLFKLD
jgi:phage terminase Nu1 subunit (DNA packaging protein)